MSARPAAGFNPQRGTGVALGLDIGEVVKRHLRRRAELDHDGVFVFDVRQLDNKLMLLRARLDHRFADAGRTNPVLQNTLN